MDTNSSITLLGIVVGALATIFAVFLQHYLSNRKKKGQKYQLVYVRLMHLKKAYEGAYPLYQANVKRLNRKIDVFDEFQMININVFHKKQEEFVGTYRTSGVVDSSIYFPWHDEIKFSDKGASLVPDFVEYTIAEPSDTYITKCVFYNGLQDGYEDIATKIKYDVDEVRLILDFSSLRTEEQLLVAQPESYHVQKDGKSQKPLGTVKLGSGVFMTEIKNGKKGEAIRMDLRINWNPVYLFAYGSLMNEESARMAKEDKKIPFQQVEAYLNGYKRTWSAFDAIFSEKVKKKKWQLF